jgi:hypothetical protein
LQDFANDNNYDLQLITNEPSFIIDDQSVAQTAEHPATLAADPWFEIWAWKNKSLRIEKCWGSSHTCPPTCF